MDLSVGSKMTLSRTLSCGQVLYETCARKYCKNEHLHATHRLFPANSIFLLFFYVPKSRCKFSCVPTHASCAMPCKISSCACIGKRKVHYKSNMMGNRSLEW